MRLLRPWAERGDAQARYGLGLMHYHGQGVAQDYAKAREWFEKAAAQTEDAENTEVVRKARQILEQIRQVR